MKMHEWNKMQDVLHKLNPRHYHGEAFFSYGITLPDGSELEIGCSDFDWCGDGDEFPDGDAGLIIAHHRQKTTEEHK